MDTNFQEWFAAQYGTRARNAMPSYTDKQLRDMVLDGKRAEKALAAREGWDAVRTAALSAWQAATMTAKESA